MDDNQLNKTGVLSELLWGGPSPRCHRSTLSEPPWQALPCISMDNWNVWSVCWEASLRWRFAWLQSHFMYLLTFRRLSHNIHLSRNACARQYNGGLFSICSAANDFSSFSIFYSVISLTWCFLSLTWGFLSLTWCFISLTSIVCSVTSTYPWQNFIVWYFVQALT